MKRALAASGIFLLPMAPIGHSAWGQEPSPKSHFVIGFRDPGPPGIHLVEARLGSDRDDRWVRVPANISLEADGTFQATTEVADAKCSFFRVARPSGDESGPPGIVSMTLGPAIGVIFPTDVSYPALVRNKELSDLTRFYGLRPGVDYLPGRVVVGFRSWVTEEQAALMLQAAGLSFSLSFPKVFHVDCRVLWGDTAEHIRRLEESGIVRCVDQREGWLTVNFRANVTVEAADALLSSIEGLGPDWTSYLLSPRYGVVYVPEGSEFAWILALELVPAIAYAEPSYLGWVAI